ncbi:hypothetical protein EST38_g191 [Candolleomyces aberdarensis]|uniref:DUF6593 domain-containing protein n=1 Tax=Candolleomyces aberdarensis TaxID=2316362 RepID=A0A4Q2E077_9AGAR|nr:hypothetical protein EST38_g191 [Candolleomyces aberdarensis]
MDLVFVCDNLIQTPVTSLTGLIYYDIVTDRQPGVIGCVTHIKPKKQGSLPIRQRLSHKAFGLLPKTLEKSVADIRWNGVTNPVTLHSKFTEHLDPGNGVEKKYFLKRKNRFSLSKNPVRFVDINGVMYRWQIHGGEFARCVLTEADTGSLVACTRKKVITEDFSLFKDQRKHTLHITKDCTLDIGLILMMFLCVDHPRLLKQYGPHSWRPKHDYEKENGREWEEQTKERLLKEYLPNGKKAGAPTR